MLIFLRRLWANQFIQAICFLAVLWIMYNVRIVLAIILLAFIVMSGFRPIVLWLTRRRIPRVLAILSPFLAFFLVLSSLLYFIIPIISTQFREIVNSLPQYFAGLRNFSNIIDTVTSELSAQLAALPVTIFTFVLSFFSVIVLSVYFLFNHHYLEKILARCHHHQGRGSLLQHLEKEMGAWLRGQAIVCLAIAFLVTVALLILQVDYAITLGVIAGFLEIVPFIGPVLSAIIAIIVASSASLHTAVLVTVVFIIIQQIENHILLPQVMKHSINLNPIVVIGSVLAGAELLGILGAIVAVPLAALGFALYDYFYGRQSVS